MSSLRMNLWFLVLMMLTAVPLQAAFSFSSRESRIKVFDSSAKLIVNTPITGYNGTLELIDNSSDRIQGQPIIFASGALETGTAQAYFTGKYDPTSTDVIKLEGNDRLRCSPGTILTGIQISGSSNRIEGAPLFSSELTMMDQNSYVAFALQNKLNKSIILNGGNITLDDNLSLGDDVTIGSFIPDDWGSIDFNGKNLTFPGQESVWTGTMYMTSASALELNAQVSLRGMWIFGPVNGKSIINGNGNVLDLSYRGTLWVRSNHTLVLNNLTIKGLGGVGGGWLLMEDVNSTLSLNNTSLILAHNYNFTQGVLYYYGADSTIVTGDKILQFALNGKLKVDGIALGYDPLSTPDINNVRPWHPDNVNLFVYNNAILRNIIGGSVDIYYDSAMNTMLKSEDIGSVKKVYFRGLSCGSSMTLNGGGFAFNCARSLGALIVVYDNKNVTLENIVLKDFSPIYVLTGNNSTLTFGDGVIIELGQAEDLNITWSFVTGTSTIKGHGCELNLDYKHAAIVYPNTTLRLQDMHLVGIGGLAMADADGFFGTTASHILSENNLRCMDDTAKVEFRSCDVVFASNYSFTIGGIDIYNEVRFCGDGMQLAYQSDADLTIKAGAMLTFDRNFTFSYDSLDTTGASKLHVVMNDATSRLHLNGSTLVTTFTGLKLQTGTMVIQDHVSLISGARDEAEAIVFDSGMKVEVLSGAALDLDGYLNYE